MIVDEWACTVESVITICTTGCPKSFASSRSLYFKYFVFDLAVLFNILSHHGKVFHTCREVKTCWHSDQGVYYKILISDLFCRPLSWSRLLADTCYSGLFLMIDHTCLIGLKLRRFPDLHAQPSKNRRHFSQKFSSVFRFLPDECLGKTFPWPPIVNFSLRFFVFAAETNEYWLKRASQDIRLVLCNGGSASFEDLVLLSHSLWGHFTRNHEFSGLLDALSERAVMLENSVKIW